LYGLFQFLSGLQNADNEQQCSDNADLLAVLADALGINVTPLFIRATDGTTQLETTTYFRAGKTTSDENDFDFHQIDQFGGLVYDPSAASKAGGPPFVAMAFKAYYNTVFSAPEVGEVTETSVTGLSIGNVPKGADLVVTGYSPNSAKVGVTASITLKGFSFDDTVSVTPLVINTETEDTKIDISNISASGDGKRLTFDMEVDAAHAVGRNVELDVSAPGIEDVVQLPFTITK
jgi:hypothetical protein